MSLRCFYVVDGAPVGPVSTEDLMTLGRTGAFSDGTLVWVEGTADWQPYSQWSVDAAPPIAPPPEPAPEALEPLPTAEAITSLTENPVAAPSTASANAPAAEPIASPAEPIIPPAGEPNFSGAAAETVEPMDGAEPLQLERAEPAAVVKPRSGRIFRYLSWTSLILLAIFFVVAAILVAKFPGTDLEGLLAGKGFGAVRLLLGLSVLSGFGALLGFRQHQGWQVIAPASIALAINAVLLLVAIPSMIAPEFLRSRQRSRGIALEVRPGGMVPVTSVAGAVRVSHPTLGFSFDVPAGFEEQELTQSSAKFWKLFARPAAPNELAEVFGIQPLGYKLPRNHLDIRHLPNSSNANLRRVSWRGVEIDTVRVSDAKAGKSYVTYNVQVPLKGEAIQLMLGAPREHEAELKTRIETLLASFDGQSDW